MAPEDEKVYTTQEDAGQAENADDAEKTGTTEKSGPMPITIVCIAAVFIWLIIILLRKNKKK